MLEKQQNKFAPILLSCLEEKFFKIEAIWDDHSFMRILSGEMKIVLANHTYTFCAGETVLVPRNQLSTVIKQPKDGRPYKSILVTFKPDFLRDFYTHNSYKPTLAQNQNIRSFDKHALLESFFASLIPYFELETALPAEVMAVKLQEAMVILRTIDRDIDCLLADFSEPGKINLAEFMEKNFMFNMPLAKYAYLTGRSIATFNRDFRKAFKSTPQKWLLQKRLALAHYHLAENRRKPIEVYLETGFENLSHFSRAFKQYFGYAPTRLGQKVR